MFSRHDTNIYGYMILTYIYGYMILTYMALMRPREENGSKSAMSVARRR